MPDNIIDELLEEDESLRDSLVFSDVQFPRLDGKLDAMDGLHIVAGLQDTTKQDCMTLFRAVRFPTIKRLHTMVREEGYSISNYEQERLGTLYEIDKKYWEERYSRAMFGHPALGTQPQERIVHGLPLFALANDALQIHRGFRGEQDMVAMCAIHIPQKLIKSEKVSFIANTAIDVHYAKAERDHLIRDFRKRDGKLEFNFHALRARGIDLHEMYTKDLPMTLADGEAMGIDQQFFLLNIARITDETRMNELFADTKLLLDNEHFLHGFFGDQNIFARRRSAYLPMACQEVTPA